MLARTGGLTMVEGADGSTPWSSPARWRTSTRRWLACAYLPTANFNGAATLTITTNDQGNTGSGGARPTPTRWPSPSTPSTTAAQHVPAAQSTNEDTALVFSTANGNAISVADVDAGSGQRAVTLGVTNGTLTLGGTTAWRSRPERTARPA